MRAPAPNYAVDIKSVAVRGEQEVLGSQRAVLDDPRPRSDPGDQDEDRGVIEDLEVRIAERHPLTVRLWASGQGCQQVGLRRIRDPVEKALIPDHRERPRLPVRRARRMHGGVEEITDLLGVYGLRRVGPRRAAARDRVVEVHRAIPFGQRCHVPATRGKRGATGDEPRSLCRTDPREAPRSLASSMESGRVGTAT